VHASTGAFAPTHEGRIALTDLTTVAPWARAIVSDLRCPRTRQPAGQDEGLIHLALAHREAAVAGLIVVPALQEQRFQLDAQADHNRAPCAERTGFPFGVEPRAQEAQGGES
jgi:hypothetical protein